MNKRQTVAAAAAEWNATLQEQEFTQAADLQAYVDSPEFQAWLEEQWQDDLAHGRKVLGQDEWE